MHPAASLLHSLGGVATWSRLTAALPAHVVKHAVQARHIVRLLPRVYALPDESPGTRLRAALLFGGAGSCLSHTSALRQWPQLHLPIDNRVHVLVPAGRQPRSTGYVRIHRGELDPALIVDRYGLPTMCPAVALVDAWAELPLRTRRAPVIDAVRIGLVDTGSLCATVQARPTLRGRQELCRLLELLAAGCRSELELLGFLRIFTDPRLPRPLLQYEVVVAGRRFVLDVAWPELLLAVELDGAAYHGSDDARERDVRRDFTLARAGWLTVRLTYGRLVADRGGIVRELAEIIATRRRQLRSAG